MKRLKILTVLFAILLNSKGFCSLKDSQQENTACELKPSSMVHKPCLYRPLRSEVFFSGSSDFFSQVFMRQALPHEKSLVFHLEENPSDYSHGLIEVRDPTARDLKRSNYVFLQFYLYPHKIAWLSQLAAPSFSGRQAMQLVWELKRITSCSHVFLGDGSTKTPCDLDCTEESMTSLKAMEVLKSGQSWYERQGGLSYDPQGYPNGFEDSIEKRYMEAFDDGGSFGTDSPWDFDRFRYHALAIIKNSLTTPEAYDSAKAFLHELPLQTLTEVFQSLADSSQIREAQQTLQAALGLIGSRETKIPQTQGDVLAALERIYHRGGEKKETAHEILHKFRDVFVSHRGSLFFHRALKQIPRDQSFSALNVARVTQILMGIPRLDVSKQIKKLEQDIANEKKVFIRDINKKRLQFFQDCSKRPHASTVSEFLGGNKRVSKDDLLILYENYLPKWAGSEIKHLKTKTSPYISKILANSNAGQQIKWLSYCHERGIGNYLEALEPAVNWLGSLSLLELSQLVPNFFEHFQHRLPHALDELNLHMTFRDYFIKLEQITSKKIVQDFVETLIWSLNKTFSDSIVELLKNYKASPEKFSQQEVYEIWFLAKLAVDQQVLYTLYSN